MKQHPCLTVSYSSFHVKNRNMTDIRYYTHYSWGTYNERDKKTHWAVDRHILIAKGKFRQFLQQRLHETRFSRGVARHLCSCFTLCDEHAVLRDKTRLCGYQGKHGYGCANTNQRYTTTDSMLPTALPVCPERLSTTWMLLSGRWIIVIVISARKSLVPSCHISSWLKVRRQQGEVSDIFTLFSAMTTGISTEWP